MAAQVEKKSTSTNTKAKASKGDNKKSTKGSPKKENIFQRFVGYVKNVRQEVKRTTWPSRDDVLRMSLIVIGALIFFGILIAVVDWVMTILLNAYSGLQPAPAPTPTDAGVVPTPDAGSTPAPDAGSAPAPDTTDTTGSAEAPAGVLMLSTWLNQLIGFLR
ncbi:MAG: preprotein translocase subunit SecE [Actinomycetia bacterium]|nr:preprotein translocase subunit SecE [Actinomycetes bacterium]